MLSPNSPFSVFNTNAFRAASLWQLTLANITILSATLVVLVFAGYQHSDLKEARKSECSDTIVEHHEFYIHSNIGNSVVYGHKSYSVDTLYCYNQAPSK